MEKVFEALEWLENKCYVESPQEEKFKECCSTIKQALLKQLSGSQYTNIYIDEFMPTSEALECLEKLKGMEISSMPFSDEYGTQEVDLNDIRKVGSQLNTDFREYTDTIKQTLIKAQDMEKVLEILKNKVDFVFYGKSKEIKLRQTNWESNVFLMNEPGDTLLPQEEFDLLERWLND